MPKRGVEETLDFVEELLISEGVILNGLGGQLVVCQQDKGSVR